MQDKYRKFQAIGRYFFFPHFRSDTLEEKHKMRLLS